MLDQCGMLGNGGQGVMSEFIQERRNEVEPITKYDSLSSSRNSKAEIYSNGYLNKHASEETLLFSPVKSILRAARDADTYIAPGNVVWVKDIRHGWWPAEVMDIRVLNDDDYQHTARVLVQFFEIYKKAWVDSSDLSQFPNCFEERSKNPSEAFQDALKQALCKHGNGSLKTYLQDRGTGEMRSPTQPNKSPASDASKSSTFSCTKDDHDVEEGRGKRKRRTKIHFDEMAVADNPARKIRRLKIMRLLGLAAPVGSPFSPSHRSS